MKIGEAQLIDKWASFIKSGVNFTFTKFGDGEAICMGLCRGENCDGQVYSMELGNKLIEAAKFLSNSNNVFIGEWNFDSYGDMLNEIFSRNGINFNYVPYSTLLNTEDAPLRNLKELYEAINNSELSKVYVCPEKLNEAKSIFGCDILNVPERNAFASYNYIKAELLKSNHKIFIYSAGLMSKVLIKDIMSEKPDTTHIDIGSGLDNIFVGQTRANQIPQEQLIKFYK